MRLLGKFHRAPFRRQSTRQPTKMVAIGPDVHRDAALAAIAMGETVRTFVETAVRERLARLRRDLPRR